MSEEEKINEKELLLNAMRHLLRSKIIREVYAGRTAPETLDKRWKEMREENKTLKKKLMEEKAENVRQRRLYGFLMDSKEGR